MTNGTVRLADSEAVAKRVRALKQTLSEIAAARAANESVAPPERARAAMMLQAVIFALHDIDEFNAAADAVIAPFWTLLLSLGDLDAGTVSAMLKPAERKGGRPPATSVEAQTMVEAAIAMDVAMLTGLEPQAAAARVARVMTAAQYRPPLRANGAPLAKTIADWRENLNANRRAPRFAVRMWEEYRRIRATAAPPLNDDAAMRHLGDFIRQRRNLINPHS